MRPPSLRFVVVCLLMVPSHAVVLHAQNSAAASFQATLAPWKGRSGELSNRVSFAGAATIGVKDNGHGLVNNLIEPLVLCDQANNFIAEFRPAAGGSVSATIKVARDLPYLVTVPLQVGGKRPTTGNYFWIEQTSAGVNGATRLSSEMVVYYSPAGQSTREYRGPVIFEASFRAAPWHERVGQGAGSLASFEKMSPHQRLPVTQWASCGTTPPNPPAPVAPSATEVAALQGVQDLADRWYTRCAAEWTSDKGPRDAYLAKCRCRVDVLAGGRNYLIGDESAALSRDFTQTLARIMTRGRRPAIYVTQRCAG